ncbi:hypothetical protein MSG28_000504 [Choristoneura fumiferana]|uniref:Uncharacterized protein n=1 Tax=Choristoneura fumiferana TaxID=7141 RepID=A0ACC0K118_CHOFU|nr:hypothetical protein MSG28_000504 [Choristoneura fumiferana]
MPRGFRLILLMPAREARHSFVNNIHTAVTRRPGRIWSGVRPALDQMHDVIRWAMDACGLHADFTELTACVGGELDRHEGSAVHRRYFYITLLREPVARYLSEYRHVKRGATWKGSRHWCQGRTATGKEEISNYDYV